MRSPNQHENQADNANPIPVGMPPKKCSDLAECSYNNSVEFRKERMCFNLDFWLNVDKPNTICEPELTCEA